MKLAFAPVLFTGLLFAVTPALADEDDMADPEAVAKINEVLGKIGCNVHEEVEHEAEDIYELDDAACAIGQYDIKFNGDFVLMSMTYDGPVDASDTVSAEDKEKILGMLAAMQCEVDTDDIEATADGYELDDVFCSDGQYDMKINDAFEVIEKNKE